MFNVILTKKDKTQYYISCDGVLTTYYSEDNCFKYEFDDFEDAQNVKMDYSLDHWQDEDADEVENIEVVQM